MVKIFTVMYILCAVYSTNPQVSEPAFTQNLVQEIVYQSSSYTPTGRQVENIAEDQNNSLDYMEELKKLGYYRQDSTDENLNIRNAVLRFQSDHNLIVDGIWGNRSLAALKKRLSDKSFSYPDTVEVPASNKKWVVVNKTKRILTLYKDKTVSKKYPIAVGNPPSLTPSGKFSIVSRVINPKWWGGGYAKPVAGGSPDNPLGYRWMGLSLNGGNQYGIHGNNKPYSIGKNVSHGCIRMINPDVEELFEIVPVRTEVWIGTEEELNEWGIMQKEYMTEEQK